MSQIPYVDLHKTDWWGQGEVCCETRQTCTDRRASAECKHSHSEPWRRSHRELAAKCKPCKRQTGNLFSERLTCLWAKPKIPTSEFPLQMSLPLLWSSLGQSLSFFLFLFICLYFEWCVCAQVPWEARSVGTWGWSYRQLRTAAHECWELSLGPLESPWPITFQFHIFPFMRRQ